LNVRPARSQAHHFAQVAFIQVTTISSPTNPHIPARHKDNVGNKQNTPTVAQ
jgi:hypothetical protein